MRTDLSLLEKEVTRKEFIAYMAAGALSIFGISNFIEMFLGRKLPRFGRTGSAVGSKAGFGSQRFGE